MAGNSMASEMVYFSIKTEKGSPVPTLIVAAIVTGGESRRKLIRCER